MKILKKISCMVLALVFVLGMFMVPSVSVEAAAKATVPKKVHVNPGNHTDYGFTVRYTACGDKIKNLKSSSKNLVVKQTYQRTTGPYYSPDIGGNNYANIGLHAKKKGTYTVSFDVYSSANKKKSSHKVKVYADYKTAVSSIKFAGKKLIPYGNVYTSKKSGKLSVKMTKGYKLKGIHVVTLYDKNGNYAYKSKKVKNKRKITLGKYASNYSYNYTCAYNPNYWYNYWNKGMYAETIIRVEYIDKYTKNLSSTSYYIYRKPANK